MKRRLMRKIAKRPFDSKGRCVYVAKIRQGGRIIHKRAICRMDSTEWDDPIMEMSGCAGEFAEDFERRDRAQGCPACLEANMP